MFRIHERSLGIGVFVCLVAVWSGCATISTPSRTSAPVTVEQLIDAGNALVTEADYESAIRQYNRALAMDITAAEAHGNLSVAYYYLGRQDEAIREAQQAIVMAPTELNWRFNLGAAYSKKENHDRAMKAYEGAVDLARRLRDENRVLLRSALIGLGRACELAQQFPQALYAYREALVFSPEDVELLAGVGNIYFRQAQYDRAEEMYRQALDIDSTHTMSRYNMGLVYAKTGRYDEAVTLFSETPDLPDQLGGAIEGSSLNTVDRSRVNRIKAFRSKLGKMGGPKAPKATVDRKQPPYTYALGITYYEQGDDAAAIDAFQRALSEDPSLAEAYFYIGNAHVRQGRTEEAISSYQEAVQTNPAFAEAYNNMGSIYAETGRVEEAMTSYQEALSLNERFYEARTNLGLLYAETGRFDDAIAEYLKVIKADVGISEAHNNLSMIYLQQGHFEEALVQSKKAIKLHRDFPEAYNNLGLAYGLRVYLEDVIDTWRTIASGWTGRVKTDGQANPKKEDWLLLRRVPAQSSEVDGAAREAYREGASLAFKGLLNEAHRSFQSALQAKPGWHAAQLASGAVLLAQERWADAVSALQQTVETNPSDPLGHASLAIGLAMNGAYNRAVETWEQTVKRAEGTEKKAARAALETMRTREKAADKALTALEKAVELRPGFTKAYFNLGILNDQLHRYNMAISSFEKVVELSPDTAIGHFRLGIAYHRIGRTRDAQQAIKQYIQLVTDPMLLPQVETFLKRMN